MKDPTEDRPFEHWAFLHFYHQDKANAAIHMKPVRFSPVTFEAFDAIEEYASGFDSELDYAFHEVLGHVGKYAVDTGR